MPSPSDSAFVYVHIGANKPNVLVHYPGLVKIFYPEAHLVLLTDNPKSWQDFPGDVVDIKSNLRTLVPIWSRLVHYDRFNVANGYWKKTLFRFFILAEISKLGILRPEEFVFHIESDVLVMPCSQTLDAIKANIEATSVVQLSPEVTIGAIVASPSAEHLSKSMKGLKEIFLSTKTWKNDMEILHQGIREFVVEPLNGINLHTNQTLMFDGWPFGQYLFGKDPIHLDGISRGGYVSPYSPTDLATGRWSIQPCNSKSKKSHHHLHYQTSEGLLQLFNLHMHSKRCVGVPDLNDEVWRSTLEAANGLGTFQDFAHNPSIFLHASNGNILARSMRKLRTWLN